jgi:hypothetical protein
MRDYLPTHSDFYPRCGSNNQKHTSLATCFEEGHVVVGNSLLASLGYAKSQTQLLHQFQIDNHHYIPTMNGQHKQVHNQV